MATCLDLPRGPERTTVYRGRSANDALRAALSQLHAGEPFFDDVFSGVGDDLRTRPWDPNRIVRIVVSSMGNPRDLASNA